MFFKLQAVCVCHRKKANFQSLGKSGEAGLQTAK
jgi:hypothetical protein